MFATTARIGMENSPATAKTARRSPRPSGWRPTRDGTRSAEWFMAGRSTATRLRRQDAIRSQSIAAPPEIHPRSGVIPDEREDPGPGRCPQPAFERPLNLPLLVVLEPRSEEHHSEIQTLMALS